ncbi:MAG: hypothetical protein WBL46_06280, partial [Nitrososphaeraceae archaeon]
TGMSCLTPRKTLTVRSMSCQPENKGQANPWSSDGDTVPQILCRPFGIISPLISLYRQQVIYNTYIII